MKRRIAATVSALIWGALLYLGISLTSNVVRQHVPGYPNAGQVHYYEWFPAFMLLLCILLAVVAKRTPKALFTALWFIQLLLLVLFLFGYTGGM